MGSSVEVKTRYLSSELGTYDCVVIGNLFPVLESAYQK
jgi:hypothetical protein